MSRAADGELRRALGSWDAILLTIGSVVGTGIFLTSGDVARAAPRAELFYFVWIAGGFLTLAGALAYAELGGLFPRAGGLYHILKETYGPLWGFLYGWASFLVIMSGGIAAIAVGFGEFLGAFAPVFATDRIVTAVPIGPWRWSISGGQIAAALAILALTGVNHWGLRAGARAQNLLTLLKVGGGLAFAALVFAAPAARDAAGAAPAPPAAPGALAPLGIAPLGLAMIAALWTYDGWYALTLSAGEMRRPGRDLARGLVIGTLAVTLLYVALNAAYVRALTLPALAATPRPAEAAGAALFGPLGGRLAAAVVLVSSLGCLAATILYAARLYIPIARDGLFFAALGRVSARHATPAASLWAQGAWATLLSLSGTYVALYTYVIFVSVLFHAAIGAALFVLRRRRPDAERPYRAWGYPWAPALFVFASLGLAANTLIERPVESLAGLGLLALGLPAYAWWRAARRDGADAHG